MNTKKIGMGIATGVLVIALCVLVGKLILDHKGSEKYTEVKNDVKIANAKESKSKHQVDFKKLKGENKDVIAWIKFPGLKIDYPILMSDDKEDTDYYLLHNFDHSDGRPGCLYVQKSQASDFSNINTIVYGHNMYNNGTMFNQLIKLQDETEFNNHKTFVIETPTQRFYYNTWAAVQFNDEHLLYQYDFSTPVGRNQFIGDVQAVRDMYSHVNGEVKVDENSKFVTLSTCMSYDSDHRYLVVGVLDKVVELED